MPCKALADLIEISDDDEGTTQTPQNPATRIHIHKAPPSKAKQESPLSNSRTEVHSLPSGSRVLKDVQNVIRVAPTKAPEQSTMNKSKNGPKI
jgi:hypothetical protein